MTPGTSFSGKTQRPFNCPRGQDYLPGPDPPQPLPYRSIGTVTQRLQGKHIAMIIDTDARRPVEQPNVAESGKTGRHFLDPVMGCHAVDGAAINRRTASPLARLLDYKNLRA